MESSKKLKTMDAESMQDLLESSPIHKVNEDILIMIFNYLSIIDRIKIEAVSQSWREIAKKSWSKVKILKLDRTFLGFKPFGTNCHDSINESEFVEILYRTGKYVKEIDFSNSFGCQISSVATYCPNIQSINWHEALREDLEELSITVQNLSEFTLERELDEDCEDALGRIFSKNKKLRKLKLNFGEMEGYCLHELPLREITKLNIKTRQNNYDFRENLIGALKQTENLSSFWFDNTDAEIIKTLAFSCKNLTEIQLTNFQNDLGDVDELFSKLFLSNRNLKSISLHLYNAQLTGECLICLNENSVEAIEFKYLDFQNFQSDYLNKCLSTFKKLHTLKLEALGDPNIHERDMDKYLSSCLNLKALELSNLMYQSDSPEILKNSIPSLKSLESLSLKLQTLSTDFYNCLNSNLLQLKNLCLCSCENLSDVDIETLHKLPNLEALDISANENITGSGLCKLPNLKKLICYYCISLIDDSLISFLKCATDLEYLNLGRCPEITNAVIEAAIQVTKLRTNNIVMRVGIQDTSVNIDTIENTPPLLVLDEDMSYDL